MTDNLPARRDATRARPAVVDGTLTDAAPAGDELPDPGAYELDPDDSRHPRLTWRHDGGDVWRSGCGRFAIARVRLPEYPERYPGSSEVYLVRRIDPHMAAVYPQSLGYHLDQALNLAAAMTEADRWAWVDDQGTQRHVPEDYPALAVASFYWPITHTGRQGVSRAALVVDRAGGRLVARVIGMTRGNDDAYRPGTWAEVDLTALVTDAGSVPGVVTPWRPRRRWWNPATWWSAH